ncbi:MAG: uroporphyrinogen decarboxylase family protein [Clostridiaceae bacterium]|nr:uroporphyrinogen decarboxylase family protein [Clostridiaceae bacterium]
MKNYRYHGEQISWKVEYNPYIVYTWVAGETMRAYFEDPAVAIRCYERGQEWIRGMFGDRLHVMPPAPYPISYGHLICLGGTYTMPEDSDLNVHPFASSVDEGIDIVRSHLGMDFSRHPLVQKYIAYSQTLRDAYPDLHLPITLPGVQGPITSVALMRGQDFYMDLYDEPEKTLELIQLMTQSTIEYRRYNNRINGVPEINPKGTGFCDDLAALVSPHLFSDYVIRAWNQLFEGLTTPEGTRFVHCEDLTPFHLKYLKEAKLTSFQPSVSDKLTLENYFANTDVPLDDWLLYSWRCADMTPAEIDRWIDDSLAGGARRLRTQFNRPMLQSGHADRITAFIDSFDRYAE